MLTITPPQYSKGHIAVLAAWLGLAHQFAVGAGLVWSGRMRFRAWVLSLSVMCCFHLSLADIHGFSNQMVSMMLIGHQPVHPVRCNMVSCVHLTCTKNFCTHVKPAYYRSWPVPAKMRSSVPPDPLNLNLPQVYEWLYIKEGMNAVSPVYPVRII